jgi:hypothetical protein
MSSNHFTVEENHEKYSDVCDIRKKKDRKETNVLNAFSGLECPGKELHEWESHSKLYKEKFKKAKQCLQRRISTMKRFPARSEKNKTSRKKHVYPIQVAYSFGKDCLKKFATKEQQNTFESSTNNLIKEISKTQTNIPTYFGNSIEQSIRNRGRNNTIKSILNQEYYNGEVTDLIDRIRSTGYNKSSKNNQERFYTIINEAFSRNAKYNEEAEEEEEEEEEVKEENETEKELINILKKEMKKRRKTKKKSLSVAPAQGANLTNLNTLLQSERFAITNEAKREEIIKRIEKIKKLFADKVLIDEKLYMLEDIFYGTFQKLNKLNRNMYSIITKTAGQPLTKKTLKRAGINEKYLTKANSYDARVKLQKSIMDTHSKLKDKLETINKDIDKLLESGNNDIDANLNDFYDNDLPRLLLEDINSELRKLNKNENKKERLSKEQKEIYNQVKEIHKLNTELAEAEEKLEINLTKQNKLETLLKLNAIKSNPDRLKTATDTLKGLKEEEGGLQKNVLDKYNKKTSDIRGFLVEINRKYVNPYILKERLERLIKAEQSLMTLQSLLPFAL